MEMSLLFLYSALRDFYVKTPVFPLHQNKNAFDVINSIVIFVVDCPLRGDK